MKVIDFGRFHRNRRLEKDIVENVACQETKGCITCTEDSGYTDYIDYLSREGLDYLIKRAISAKNRAHDPNLEVQIKAKLHRSLGKVPELKHVAPPYRDHMRFTHRIALDKLVREAYSEYIQERLYRDFLFKVGPLLDSTPGIQHTVEVLHNGKSYISVCSLDNGLSSIECAYSEQQLSKLLDLELPEFKLDWVALEPLIRLNPERIKVSFSDRPDILAELQGIFKDRVIDNGQNNKFSRVAEEDSASNEGSGAGLRELYKALWTW